MRVTKTLILPVAIVLGGWVSSACSPDITVGKAPKQTPGAKSMDGGVYDDSGNPQMTPEESSAARSLREARSQLGALNTALEERRQEAEAKIAALQTESNTRQTQITTLKAKKPYTPDDVLKVTQLERDKADFDSQIEAAKKAKTVNEGTIQQLMTAKQKEITELEQKLGLPPGGKL